MPAAKKNKTAAKPTKTAKPAARPTKRTAKPLKKVAKPAKATAKPAKATAKPAKATAKPAKATAKPAKATAKPAKPAATPTGDTSSRQAKALMDAASQGKLAEVEALLGKGADPKVLYQDSSALAWAAYKGHVEIVKLLLAHGADPNAGRSFPAAGNAMHAAAKYGSVEILELLHAAGGDPSSVGQKPSSLPLFCAAERGHGPAVAWLLEHGADPHVVAQDRSAMLAAAMGGSPEVLDVLHARGASLETGWRKPLHQAIRSGQPAAVRWFLAHGFDPNAREHGEGSATALHLAAEHQEHGAEMIDILVAAGAQLEARCDSAAGRAEHPTPLQVAIDNSNPGAVERLLHHGADPAASTGDDEVVDARAMAKQTFDAYGGEDPADGYVRVYRILWPNA